MNLYRLSNTGFFSEDTIIVSSLDDCSLTKLIEIYKSSSKEEAYSVEEFIIFAKKKINVGEFIYIPIIDDITFL